MGSGPGLFTDGGWSLIDVISEDSESDDDSIDLQDGEDDDGGDLVWDEEYESDGDSIHDSVD